MSQRYKIRTFESGDQDGAVSSGTIVVPIDRSFSVYSRSADDAERKVQEDLSAGKLPVGRVYQICPPFGNSESIRAFSVCNEGHCQRVFLDPASGIYSEFKRIRHQDLRKNAQREAHRAQDVPPTESGISREPAASAGPSCAHPSDVLMLQQA